MIPWRGLRDEWVMLGLALLASAVAMTAGRPSPGDPLVVEVGVVPIDATQLACAGPGCAFDEHEQPATGAEPLRPFVTVGGQLIVMSGVFESPKVRAWLDSAPQQGTKLSCPAVLLERSAQRKVRFRTSDAFGLREVAVLSAKDCDVVR